MLSLQLHCLTIAAVETLIPRLKATWGTVEGLRAARWSDFEIKLYNLHKTQHADNCFGI